MNSISMLTRPNLLRQRCYLSARGVADPHHRIGRLSAREDHRRLPSMSAPIVRPNSLNGLDGKSGRRLIINIILTDFSF